MKSEANLRTFNHAVWIIKVAIWENLEIPVKYLAWSKSGPVGWVKWFQTEKHIGDDLHPMREQDTGQQKV